MKKKHVIGIALFWILCAIWFLAYKEYTNIVGTVVYLKSVPVDPNDVFRGDYVILWYDISSINCVANEWDAIYIPLTVPAVWAAVWGACSTSKPEWLFIRWTKKWSRNVFGIEKYFVQEGTGKEIEQKRATMLVKVKIDNFGRSLVKGFKFE